MKKILFIQPPFYRFIGLHSRYFPYQFASMGTVLKKEGHLIRIFESDKTADFGKLDFSKTESLYSQYLEKVKDYTNPFWNQLSDEINKLKPDYIGITVWTTFIASSIYTARFCKDFYPSAILIAGGPHTTLLPDDIKKMNCFDIGIIGEGELSILDILNGKSFDTIDGIFFKKKQSYQTNTPRKFIENLDSLGIPDRSLLVNKNNYTDEDMGLIMTSRGCPYSCSYCATSIWKNRVRYRSIENVINEIKNVKQNYKTTYFTFKDDSFILNKNRIKELCKRITDEKLKIVWECNANLQTVNIDLLKIMKKAGCVAIKVGIESGSNRILDIINKKLTTEIIETKIKEFKKSGIHLTCYFMLGIPGETKEDIIKTLDFAFKLKPDFMSFSVYEIFPKTKLHDIGIEEGSAFKDMSEKEYCTTEPHNFYFTNLKRHLKTLPQSEFDDLIDKVITRTNKYNRSPYIIFRRIKSRIPLYLKNIKYFFYDIKLFFKWI